MLDRIADGVNLSILHATLTFIGLVATVYVMQMAHAVAEKDRQTEWVLWLGRGGLALLMWGMLWSLSFAFQKEWQPWPPQLLVYAAVDIIMIARGLSLHNHMKRVRDGRAYRVLHNN
jgi:hypothetical protein